MADNAVLDKGVILGFCFLSDPHHERCTDYINSGNTDYFTTEGIEQIFDKKKEDIISRHKEAILGHAKEITTRYHGELTRADIVEIQEGINRENNDAWRYLLDFYKENEGRTVYEITKNLRNIARDLEQRAEARKNTLYPRLNGWIRFDQHLDIQDVLKPLRIKDEEDFWICIDAHDIAVNIDGKTELATTNPSDFGIDEIQELILEETAVDEIVYVFVSRDYDPSG